MCGRSCTFDYYGDQYRDTDWYETTAMGGPVIMQGRAEFPLMLILIYGTECNNLQYEVAQAATCEVAEVTHVMSPGADVWLWVGASVFEGVPESQYVFTVCGIGEPPTAVEQVTWGSIKRRFAGLR
jgi:hypothetical protein